MSLFKSLLVIHIFSGCIALFTSVAALSTKKGKHKHRWFGRYFFYSMNGLFVTAMPMSILIENRFLFCIAIFSYYLAWTGWRYALRRQLPASLLDKTMSLIMLLVSLAMISIALWSWRASSYESIVLLFFGFLSARFSLSDFLLFRHSQYPKHERFIRHIGGMVGGTIAVFTAVLVVNVSIQPEWLLWLGPTIIFLPLITYWIIRVKKGTIYS